MGLNDIVITKLTKGLNRPAAVEDGTSALVMGGVAASGTAGSIGYGDPVLLYGIEDAEDRGITAQYDIDNQVLVWYHISEFFRFAEGQKLYVYLVSQTTPLADMCDKANAVGIWDLIQQTEGKVRQVGVVLNPITGYTPSLTDGLNDDVLAAIPNAQALAEDAYDAHYPLEVFIEGRDFDGTSPSSGNDLRTFNDEYVSVVIAQDLDICAVDTLHEGYAAVGTYLGMTASKDVATSPAEVGVDYQGNLTRTAAPARFVNYGMGNQPLSAYSATDQDALYDYHYVALRIFAGTPGVYFTQSFTCANDENDFIFMELNRSINKAARGIYKAYVPYINTKVQLKADGTLPPEVAKSLEDVGNKVFAAMEAAGEISAGITSIDPSQIILTSRKLQVKWRAVPMGKLEAVDGEISFNVSIA